MGLLGVSVPGFAPIFAFSQTSTAAMLKCPVSGEAVTPEAGSPFHVSMLAAQCGAELYYFCKQRGWSFFCHHGSSYLRTIFAFGCSPGAGFSGNCFWRIACFLGWVLTDRKSASGDADGANCRRNCLQSRRRLSCDCVLRLQSHRLAYSACAVIFREGLRYPASWAITILLVIVMQERCGTMTHSAIWAR